MSSPSVRLMAWSSKLTGDGLAHCLGLACVSVIEVVPLDQVLFIQTCSCCY